MGWVVTIQHQPGTRRLHWQRVLVVVIGEVCVDKRIVKFFFLYRCAWFPISAGGRYAMICRYKPFQFVCVSGYWCLLLCISGDPSFQWRLPIPMLAEERKTGHYYAAVLFNFRYTWKRGPLLFMFVCCDDLSEKTFPRMDTLFGEDAVWEWFCGMEMCFSWVRKYEKTFRELDECYRKCFIINRNLTNSEENNQEIFYFLKLCDEMIWKTKLHIPGNYFQTPTVYPSLT